MTQTQDDAGFAIRVDNLTVYYGQTPSIRGVCLNVRVGEYLGIIGPNGGGKSTLLKAILGLIPALEGTVRIFGKPVLEGRKHVGYVPQFSTMNKRFPITLEEVVLTGRVPKGIAPFFRYKAEDWDIAHFMMQRMGIDKLARRQACQLSGGEFQKMLIARALTTRPKLLILDEPTASVDVASREQIYELLDQLHREMTIVMVSHDMSAIASQVSEVACLNKTLVYHGEPELSESVVHHLYGCPVDLIAHGVPHRVLREHDDSEG